MTTFIIGAGIWGLTMARLIVERFQEMVVVVDRRSHPGGNSWSYFDADTGIECHKFGSHIFHTSISQVWDFTKQFGEFTGYRHKVLATHANAVYAMPINLYTINHFYKLNMPPEEAREFIRQETDKEKIAEPQNLEEKAISQIGRPLYEAFIRSYTAKQWGREPADLPAEIISRLPVRYNYETGYFGDTWQGVPSEGFDKFFRNMADHPLITLELNCEFKDIRHNLPQDARVIYTGLPDELFDFRYGELEWRSLKFEWETLALADFQGTAVMNYPDQDVPFTRIHEFKHYNPERSEVFAAPRTIICREYPAPWHAGASAYYPVPSARNRELYKQYEDLAAREKIILGGRLGRYKYLDMDKAIADAMEVFREKLCDS